MIINCLEIIALKCSSVCKWARVDLSFFLHVAVVVVMFWGGVVRALMEQYSLAYIDHPNSYLG